MTLRHAQILRDAKPKKRELHAHQNTEKGPFALKGNIYITYDKYA